MRNDSKPVPTVAEWGAIATAILGGALSKDDLLTMAGIASLVQTHAVVQAVTLKDERGGPHEDELLTPAQVSKEFGTSKWSVSEAIRRKALAVWRPHPEARRNLKVRRGIAREWVGIAR